MKKNIVLADCVPEEVATLLEGLEQNLGIFDIKSHIANWKRTGKKSELKRYIEYFKVGFYYFVHRNQYDIIIGWQQFYVLIFAFFCNIFHVKKVNTLIALNFTYKAKNGSLSGIYRWFMKKCIKPQYMDYLHVLSENYADIISREFHFPRERILVTGFGVPDMYTEFSKYTVPKGYQKNGYALSIGRSNRDFDFLISAWEKIDYPLVIISDTYDKKIVSEKIKIFNNIAGEESYPWIANCNLMIIPIQDGNICSGDTVLLNAMSCKKNILVTIPSTLAEMYVVDGENAVLSKKDENMFHMKVNEILFQNKYEGMGDCARKYFVERYSRKAMGQRLGVLIKSEEKICQKN